MKKIALVSALLISLPAGAQITQCYWQAGVYTCMTISPYQEPQQSNDVLLHGIMNPRVYDPSESLRQAQEFAIRQNLINLQRQELQRQGDR